MKAPAGRSPSGRDHINRSFTVIVGAAISHVVNALLQ
jgi:hypothetical protein